MSAKSSWRGHPIIERGADWFYVDDGSPVAGPDRPCGRCGQPSPLNELDPCLGMLPGVANACCGHGEREESYIQFTNGVRVSGFIVSDPRALTANKRHCIMCARVEGDFYCTTCVRLHFEPASSARLELAAVRTWMAEHCMEPTHRETIKQLTDVMLWADKEKPNGQQEVRLSEAHG